MIKIEVTGHSIAEVSDKLLAIGASLQRDVAKKEVAEAKTPNAETQAAIEEVAKGETVKSETVEAAIAELNEPEALASELNFDTDIAPLVLQVVKDKGKPVAQEILSQFGVEKASNLDTSRWPELVAALQDAL
jgi:hypothetical protein